jgi:hypothetical protein
MVPSNEYQWPPRFGSELDKAMSLPRKGRVPIETRRPLYAAVETVCPPMVGALKDAARASPARNDHATVLTDIGKGSQATVVIAHHDYRHSSHVTSEVLTRFANGLYAAYVLPRRHEDAGALVFFNARVDVPPSRQSVVLPIC